MSDDTGKPLDVGTFFDRPPPPALLWLPPALTCAVLVVFALFVAFCDASTARILGCSAYFSIAAGLFQRACARYTERADALRRRRDDR